MSRIGFRTEIARGMAKNPSVAFAFLEHTAHLLALDTRELSHRLEAQLDTAVARAQPSLIAPATQEISDSVNRDLTDVVRELEQGVGRGDFGRPHWSDRRRDVVSPD